MLRKANRAPKVERLARAVTGSVVDGAQSAAGVSVAVATEIGWIGVHLAMYPLGLVTNAVSGNTRALDRRRAHGLSRLSPIQRGLIHSAGGVDIAATPIVLVHGIGDNHTIFAMLGRELRRRGFTSLWTFDYGLLTADVRSTARRLADLVVRVSAETEYDRVHIIGHSLGGLVARYFVQRLGGDTLVDTLVTLGTPHQGTQAARLASALPLVRQLTPDSDLMRELAESADGCQTRFVAFHTDLDHLIVPGWRARLEHPDLHATNVAVHRVGHMSLTNNRTVAHQIAATLSELDRHDESSPDPPHP